MGIGAQPLSQAVGPKRYERSRSNTVRPAAGACASYTTAFLTDAGAAPLSLSLSVPSTPPSVRDKPERSTTASASLSSSVSFFPTLFSRTQSRELVIQPTGGRTKRPRERIEPRANNPLYSHRRSLYICSFRSSSFVSMFYLNWPCTCFA